LKDAQSILEEKDPIIRLEMVSMFLSKCIERVEVSKQINETIRKKNQNELRKLLIRGQIKELQNQLGNDEEFISGSNSVSDDLKKKFDNFQLSSEADLIVKKEE
jgi:ATP-dependent Lon protease